MTSHGESQVEVHGCQLVSVAVTGEELVDFGPYVASISDADDIAFYARCRDGAEVAMLWTDGCVRRAATRSDERWSVVSHPDIAAGHAACAFVGREDGASGLATWTDGEPRIVWADELGLASIGPLGPTVNRRGDIVLRAVDAGGVAGIYLWRRTGQLVEVASATGDHQAFEGLPCVTDGGTVVFRSTTGDGRAAIYRWTPDGTRAVVTTGIQLSSLGRFPHAADDDAIAFVAETIDGGSGVFVARDETIHAVATTAEGFRSFRGALVDGRGRVVFYATPIDGELGIYVGAPGQRRRVLGIGDALFGAPVTEFALNPVSINVSGRFAVRVSLATGAQHIVAVTPVAT